MADGLFKRYLEIGASVLGMSRERAESIVRDLVASGEVAKGQAGRAADWLVERGRAGTEELAEIVRREIREQVAALGLATKDDLARLEAQIDELRAATANAATPTASAAASPRAKAAGAGPAKAAAGAGKKAPGPIKAPGPTRAPGPTKAPRTTKAAGTTKSAGIRRSGSVRTRPGASSPPGPDAAPPAGGAARPKG